MPRKTRKYYQPKNAECRARISASMRAYQQRVREALARVQEQAS